jgi:dipeptidyl aminopeptidase/acylaminoacyl peptidase
MSRTTPHIVALVIVGLVGAGAALSKAQSPAANGPLVFQRFAGPFDDGRTAQLVTRSPEGTERQITHFAGGAFQPAWSPDGARIAFTRWFTRAHRPDQLYTVTADGTGVRKVTSGCTRARCLGDDNPSWSPEGRRHHGRQRDWWRAAARAPLRGRPAGK